MIRRQPQQKRAKVSVEAIIEAGFISIAKHGIIHTTTVHIADIAGISPGTLYQYFSNKEAVYEAMERHFIDDILTMLNAITPELIQMDVRGATTQILNTFTEMLLKDDGRYLKYSRQAMHLLDPHLSNYIKEIEKKLQEVIIQYVMHHPDLMRIRNIPTFSYMVINGGILIILRYLSDPTPSISFEQLIEGLGNMAVSYIASEIQSQQ
ncbi:TetR/AcrR family transcriptional regulator [Aquirhabdus sp.]|uniref:TetR/AcrR family transcriptional regulator n=1 Tax=Aquirhabdus sp. TaxID=2824160 RepID=UPI00396C6860